MLNRGRSLGSFAKADVSRDELTRLMAGGAELDQLAHELERPDRLTRRTFGTESPMGGDSGSDGARVDMSLRAETVT